MNIEELKLILSTGGFREDSYSFQDRHPNEALCLRQEDDQWLVYYAERGLQTGKTLFTTEHEACRHLLEKMRADPTTRKSWNSGFHA